MNTISLLAQENGGGSPLGLLILIIPMAALLWLTIVPQRKQRQRQADLLSRIAPGDEVITTGGIIGTINDIEDQTVHLEVDTDVVIRVAKASIGRTTAEPDPAERTASRSRRGGLLANLSGAAPSGGGKDAGDDAGDDAGKDAGATRSGAKK